MVEQIKNKVIEKVGVKRVAKVATGVAVGVTAAAPAFADTASNTLVTDAGTITSMATNVMSLFGTYPLNIILAMCLLGGVIGVVSQLKNAAG